MRCHRREGRRGGQRKGGVGRIIGSSFLGDKARSLEFYSLVLYQNLAIMNLNYSRSRTQNGNNNALAEILSYRPINIQRAK